MSLKATAKVRGPYVPSSLQGALDEPIRQIVELVCNYASELDGRYAAAPLYYVVDELTSRLVEDGVFWSEAMIEGTLSRLLREMPHSFP